MNDVIVQVLDEADRLLDDLEFNFGDQLRTIFNSLPSRRQTLLFSATMTERLKEVSELSLHTPYVWASKDSYVEQLFSHFIMQMAKLVICDFIC